MGFMSLFTTQEPFVTYENASGEGNAIPLDALTAIRNPTITQLREAIEGTHESRKGIRDVEIVRGKWWARYSAPGYMDATEWCGPFDTEREAIEECTRLYGDDDQGVDEEICEARIAASGMDNAGTYGGNE
jgi:hypothetical protein